MPRLIRFTTPLLAVAMLLIFVSSSFSGEATEDVPSIIHSGVNAYKTSGPEAAIKAWLANGPMDGNKDAMVQANHFRQVQAYYGEFLSYSLVQVHTITPMTKVVYMTLNYKLGAAFAKFLLFKPETGDWTITAFDFNTKAEAIFPHQLLSK